MTPQFQGARLVDGRYEPLPIQYTEENIAYIRSQVLGLDLQLRNAFKEMGIAPLPKALRFYDPQTNRILPSQEEVLEERNDTLQALDNAEQRADSAEQRADSAEQRSAALADKLRTLGIDPDEV